MDFADLKVVNLKPFIELEEQVPEYFKNEKSFSDQIIESKNIKVKKRNSNEDSIVKQKQFLNAQLKESN